MAKKFEVSIEAERFIHNDLSNCAWGFQQRTKKQFESGKIKGVYHTMMASIVFAAFSIEAKVNFVGWSTLKGGWPERANLREKIELLNGILRLGLSWGDRPLQTIQQLKRFRDTLAHGKPEIVEEVAVVEIEPDVWDALRAQWERSVTQAFVDRCIEDEECLWRLMLKAAKIPEHETLTHGGHSLRTLVEPDGA